MKKIMLLAILSLSLDSISSLAADSGPKMEKKFNVGKLFVISAPSGAGKTTLVNALLNKLDKNSFKKVVTFTSRSPRTGEANGMDYHFVSKSDFEQKIKEGFFIEWSMAYGAYYGCPKYVLDEVESGTSYFAIVDRNGANSIKTSYSKSILIWLTPPSIQVLKERLIARATESEAQIAFRLALAEQELLMEERNSIFHHRVVNDDFHVALSCVETIIVSSFQS